MRRLLSHEQVHEHSVNLCFLGIRVSGVEASQHHRAGRLAGFIEQFELFPRWKCFQDLELNIFRRSRRIARQDSHMGEV
jgi:hypothetical protein